MRQGLSRAVEAPLALVALAALSPLLAVVALAVAASSRGGVLFRQERVGRGGRPFQLLKFRSMRVHQEGPRITSAGDRRVTSVGRILRRTKLDELPALWNVLVGEMSFVGPRPEVAEYVHLDDPLWQAVLAVRPGLTDPTTLALRHEEELLRSAGEDALDFYAGTLVPYKLRGSADYLARRTVRSDLAVIGRTLLAVVLPARGAAPTREEIEAAVGDRGARRWRRGR